MNLTRHSLRYHWVTSSLQSISRLLKHSLGRKLACLILIFSLLLLPNSSQAFTHLPVLASSAVEVTSLPVNYLSTLLRWMVSRKAKPPQETVASRTSRVSRIRITPFKLVGYIGETQTFSAVGLDASGEIVHGAKFTWESEKTDKISIDEAGRTNFLAPGQTRIICRAGSTSAEATVQVRPIRRPRQSDSEWKTDQDSLQGEESGAVGLLNVFPSLLDKIAPTASAQGTLGNDMGQSADGGVGNPRNAALEQTRLGSVMPQGNFNMGIPILDLGGRGLTANLSLYYNSNVWGGRFDQALNTTVYTFDPIQSWPSPGFTLGFGRIAYYHWQYDPTYTGTWALMLIDPDGTRHSLGRVAQGNPTTVQTTDGTYITYVGSVLGGGTLYFQNGTKVTIGFVNNRLLPTQIIDTNGNYISIAYQQASMGFAPMAIASVTDTLGRVIQFNYAGTTLMSVNPPSGSPMNFNYQTVTMNTNFQNEILTENVGASFYGISGVTAPNRPPYTFTYSGYGMIYNVAWASGGLTGSVNFNYPTGGEELYSGPKFTQRTETATNSPTGVYTYANDGWITRPDGSKLRLTGPGGGEIKTSAGVTLANSVFTFANDPGGSPQVQSVTRYDENNVATKVDFSYDQYGNVTDKREYGEKIGGLWKVRRRTHYSYIDYEPYISAYLRSLNTRVEVFDALENTNDWDDVLVQKTDYHYDSSALQTYAGANPPNYSAGYASAARGNPTGTAVYTSLAGGGTSITHSDLVDVFGNTVKTQVACCNEQSFTYGADTYWSSPNQVMKGSPSGLHLTSSMEYNFGGGTLSEQTDPNGQITTYAYNGGNPTGATLPSGASSSTTYNAWSLPTSSTRSYAENGVTKNITTSTIYNGFGQPVQEINMHGGQVNIAYDAMGRESSRTNPFPQGGTPAPATTFTYDVLGRTMLVTLPGGNTTQTTYGGKVTIYTDEVNRKSKREVDSLGRLIKVTEQDVSTGLLTQETSYTYDIADHLLQVNQGGQLRSLKYDAAGRVMFEKIPEQTATINDGTGVLWTTKYTYTDFGAVATKTDARGVITNYGYDTLNRLTSISYNVSGAPGVAATPTVTYNYDNVQTSPTKGLLLSVTVGSTYTESYTYTVGSGAGGGTDISESGATYAIDSRNYTANFQHNQAGQHTQFGHVYYEYDSRGRLSALKNSAGVVWLNNMAYNIGGQITGSSLNTSGGAVNETFGYDPNRLQLTSHTATKGTSLMNLTYSNAATAGQQGAGSTAGNNGQLMSVSGTINSVPESATYTYDNLGRLVTSNQTTNGASVQRRFEYDRQGNRTNTYDATSGGTQIQNLGLHQPSAIPNNRVRTVNSSNAVIDRYYVSGQAGSPTILPINRTGRYVAVQLVGSNYLHMAEVKVLTANGTNVALNRPATQSSNYGVAAAGRAVDGNTDGNYNNNSVSHTLIDDQAWWKVDIGMPKIGGGLHTIANLEIWNRTDCCGDRLSNFYVYVSDEPFILNSYDSAGNLTNDGLHSYQYDAENRVVSVDGGATASYSYNHKNHRVKQTAGSATTHFVCHNTGVLAEYNGATGALLVQYVTLGTQQIAKIEGGVTSFYLSDSLSARVILNASGAVIGRQSHLPYGEELGVSGTADKHRFTTYEREDVVGNDYAWHRRYAYGAGRFLSSDPYKASGGTDNPQSWNRYSYVMNNPVNFIDPSGLLIAAPAPPNQGEPPTCMIGVGGNWSGSGASVSLIHADILERVVPFDDFSRTARFDLTKSIACDGSPFPIIVTARAGDTSTTVTADVDFSGDGFLQIGERPSVVQVNNYLWEVRINFKRKDREGGGPEKVRIRYRVHARKGGLYPSRGDDTGRVEITCNNSM